MRPSALNRARRASDLEALAGGEVVDVVVVGGGITGVGIALDAATRGLSIALVERGDLAAGTSRWSSKLIHGGLRYLATGDLDLAYESARERAVLMQRTAPHLTRALPMLLPARRGSSWRGLVVARTGFAAGSALRTMAGTSPAVLPPPRWVGASRTTRLFPTLWRDGLLGGFLNWEGQLVDDARLVVAVARTAAAFGARIVTHARVEAVDGGEVQVRDLLGGSVCTVRGRAVVNATGVWAGQLDRRVALRPSKGAHVVVRGEALGDIATALVVPIPDQHNRYVFALPQFRAPGRHAPVLVGLTDDEVDAVEDVPVAEPAERRFLLEVLNSALEREVRQEDVIGSFAGLRPLLAGAEGATTADLSRRHRIIDGKDGPLTVVGGKLTTYRRMASDVVDHLAARDRLRTGPCITARQPLVGAAPRRRLRALRAPAVDAARYGIEAEELARRVRRDPKLGTPLYAGGAHRIVDVLWATALEGAVTVDDVLDGRLRLDLHPEARTQAEPVVRALLEDPPLAWLARRPV